MAGMAGASAQIENERERQLELVRQQRERRKAKLAERNEANEILEQASHGEKAYVFHDILCRHCLLVTITFDFHVPLWVMTTLCL